jgi:hypothetical protein
MNISMQERHGEILTYTDKLRALQGKIVIWKNEDDESNLEMLLPLIPKIHTK